jgi:hypothetical protein
MESNPQTQADHLYKQTHNDYYTTVVKVMGVDSWVMLQQEQKRGWWSRANLECFQSLEVFEHVRSFLEVKENTSLMILSQYHSPFISYKYTSLVSNKSKMRHKEQY